MAVKEIIMLTWPLPWTSNLVIGQRHSLLSAYRMSITLSISKYPVSSPSMGPTLGLSSASNFQYCQTLITFTSLWSDLLQLVSGRVSVLAGVCVWHLRESLRRFYFRVRISSLAVFSLLVCQCIVLVVDVDRLRQTNSLCIAILEYVYQYACISLSLYG